MTTIDNLIALYKARLARAEQIRALISGDSDFAKELLQALTGPVAATDSPQTSQGKGTQYAAIRHFFEARNNEWATIAQIAEAIGVSGGAVAQNLYKSRAANFEKKNHPKHGRIKLWRLRTAEGGTL